MAIVNEWHMAANIGAGLGFGAIIGLERQWRARMAGLRTNALVAAGSALFVLLSIYGFSSATSTTGYDGSRVAAQIVSGIGFLGAGVIMRDGLSVRGLNTAATLWCSAAVGALAGTGLYVLAALGTVGVVGANTLLRPLARGLDRGSHGGAEVVTDYHFEVVCTEPEEAHVRTLVVQAVTRPGFRLRSVHSRDAETAGKVTVSAELTTERRDDSLLEEAVSRLSLEPAVSAVSWTVLPPDDDNGEEDEDYDAGRRARRRVRNLFTGR
ncbi:MgtC/SapB family protein [Streptomyces griseocarneus]|uniref:MgtC/SapB family protein n=1 Tax=Streptomyces griseocarneus TaxID=51201 RepID=UPI0019AC04FB|nr:MgtC/SapB family protein [Streptomyces griseocarneus]MBZ6472652.1 MgtC/SapB family protein [Streptomyces griseocarneus]GHG46520.1 membrane protein [Streptomyces griseocarneus]